MSTIGPGTLLICVDDSPNYKGQAAYLTKDALYRCEKVIVMPAICKRDGCGRDALVITGARRPQFCPNRFKPFIDGLDEEIEQEIKEPEHA